jgi:DMSO/TMAO reductase YedYZ molybdopterin-dependent catalytic subunit
MKQNRIFYFLLTLTACLSLGLAACDTAHTATAMASAVPASKSALELISPNGSHTFTLEQLKALPVTTGLGGNKSSAGVITLPANYKGVSLKDLVATQGIILDDSMGVTLTAQDGYSMTFSYDQVMNGNFTAYDPATGTELTTHDPLTAILAYEKDGKPLDPVQDGALHLEVVSPKNNQVVDGHWTEKWVIKVEIKPVGQTWTLKLHGAVMQPVDRASFQSCASCHGASWKDENGQNWVGVSLWRLVGQVDDANSHGTGAFNDALADAGYKVDLVSTDGTTVTLDSASIKRNDNILVAYLVNDAELPDKYYPLRLVGSDVNADQMVGKIAMIVVHVPEAAPTATVTAAAASTVHTTAGSLTIGGLVANQLSLTEDALRAMGAATISADQPKVGTQTFTGVRLSTLLGVAQVQPGASKLFFTASDGYSAEIDLATVTGCADCMLAFTSTPGSFLLVMPGQQGEDWVKNVIKIEVK